jgi:hypothetical protein
MPEPTQGTPGSVSRMILVPALITLAVTVLRLAGELLHWSSTFFNASSGGGWAIVGIVWLVPVFGIYFAVKLARAGQGPRSAGKAIGLTVLGIVIFVVGGFVGFAPQIHLAGKEYIGYLVMAVGAAAVVLGWPALFKTLIAYAYAARVPVLIVMFFAIHGSWGTHYDALPPEYAGPTALWPKFFEIAFLPQMVFWVAFTILAGALFGSVVAAFVGRKQPAEQAA